MRQRLFDLPNDSDKKFLIDTSAFVEFEQLFSPDNWEPVWDFLDGKIQARQLFTIEDVFDELERRFKESQIYPWVMARKEKLLLPYDSDHFEYLTATVYPSCPGIIDLDLMPSTSEYADPMLLAVAGREELGIITDEKIIEIQANTKSESLRLPNHCKALKIPCFHGRYAWQEYLEKQGFNLKKSTK